MADGKVEWRRVRIEFEVHAEHQDALLECVRESVVDGVANYSKREAVRNLELSAVVDIGGSDD